MAGAGLRIAYCTCLAYLSAPRQARWRMAGLRNRGTSSVATSKALPRSGSLHVAVVINPEHPASPDNPENSMTDEGVVVVGIPIHSSSPLFLSIVALHVTAGI